MARVHRDAQNGAQFQTADNFFIFWNFPLDILGLQWTAINEIMENEVENKGSYPADLCVQIQVPWSFLRGGCLLSI